MDNGTQTGTDWLAQNRQRLAAQMAAAQAPTSTPSGGVTPAPPPPGSPGTATPGAPGAAPAPAPGGAPSPAPQTDAQAQQLMRQVMTPRQHLPIPYQKQPSFTQSASGLLPIMMMTVGNAVARHKQDEINKHVATVFQPISDWYDRAQDMAAQTGQDPGQIFSQMANDPKHPLYTIFHDPKNAKLLGKTFSYDAMNPEKNNTTGRAAMQQVMKMGMAKKAMEAMKQAFTSHQQRTQDQGQPPDYAARALGTVQPTPPDIKTQEAVLKDVGAFGDAAMEQRRQEALALGMDPKSRDFQDVVLTGKMPTLQKPSSISKGITGDELMQLGAPLLDGTTPTKGGLYDVWLNTDGTKFAMPSGVAQNAVQARMAGTSGSGLGALIMRSVKGGPDAQDAKDAVKEYVDVQSRIRKAGVTASAQYHISNYLDSDSGEMMPLSSFDAEQMIRQGRKLQKVGELSAQQTGAAQRIISEAYPALKEVRQYTDAFDNSEDRKIFARILAASGPPTGDLHAWIGNVANQNLVKDLSPHGKLLVNRLKRLNDSIYTLRPALGIQATDSATSMLTGMIPGAVTNDKAMADDLLDQLEQVITNSVEIPALRGVTGGAGGSGGRPTGGTGGGVSALVDKYRKKKTP